MHKYALKTALSVFVLVFVSGCFSSLSVRKADKLALKGDWDEAALIYADALQDNPGNVSYTMKYRNAVIEASRLHYERGVMYVKEKKYDAAILEFQASYMLDPNNKKAEEDYKKTKSIVDSFYYYGKGMELLKSNNLREARTNLKKAVKLYPGNEAASEELAKLKKEVSVTLDGVTLDIKSSAPITLEFKDAGIKNIFGVLSKLSGINFIFDADLRDTRTSISVKDASFKEVLELLLQTNAISKKVTSENTIIIYPSNPTKDRQYEDLMIRVFYLTNIDAKKAVNLLRTIIKAKDVYVHEELNALVMRAKPDAIELAEKILATTDKADSEVILAVEILEVSKNNSYNVGVNVPSTFTVAPTNPDSAIGASPALSGLFISNLNKITAGTTLVTIPPGTVNLYGKDGSANILANPKIRVKNNQKAKIHIGERVPIITASVSGTTDTRTETVQYQDVGVKLNVEPTIRPNDEIDLKLSLEVSTLGTKTVTASGSIVYQIGTRNVETNLRLYDGETQVIGGLLTKEERDGKVKIPGFGDLPVLGRLFASNSIDSNNSEILLSITPYVVKRVDVPDREDSSLWSGREDSPSSSGVPYDAARSETVPAMPDTGAGDNPAEPSGVTSTPPVTAPSYNSGTTPKRPVLPDMPLPPLPVFEPEVLQEEPPQP